MTYDSRFSFLPCRTRGVRAAGHVRQTAVLPVLPPRGAEARRRHAERFRVRETPSTPLAVGRSRRADSRGWTSSDLYVS